MKYVTEKYQHQLEELADSLVTPERFAGSVVVEQPAQLYLFPVPDVEVPGAS